MLNEKSVENFGTKAKESFDSKKKALEKQSEMLKKQEESIMENIEIFKKYANKKPETVEEYRELCSCLCFGSLSFCCGTPNNPFGGGKPCPYRDMVLKILDISNEEFIEIKKEIDDSFYKKILG